MANTMIYKEDYTTKLQETLDAPTSWKDVCRVEYTTSKVIHNPYQSKAAASSYTRGSQYTFADFTITDDSVNINNGQIVPEFIDRADLAQVGYAMQMERAQRQGEEINLTIEEAFVGDYASMTLFDNASIGGAAGDIVLSSTNVDDVIRNVKRRILANNGGKMLSRNGGFIIWDTVSFEKVEAFAQANGGYIVQDNALRDGANAVTGFYYMGFMHYVSNSLVTETSTTHVIAGVKKAYHIGILSTTYGEIVIDEEPDRRSGIGIISRVDFKGKLWANMAGLMFNVTIAA